MIGGASPPTARREISSQGQTSTSASPPQPLSDFLPPVALVCRQLYAEALPLFYALNTFDISFDFGWRDDKMAVRPFVWLRKRSPASLRRMQCDVVFGRFTHERGRHGWGVYTLSETCKLRLDGLLAQASLLPETRKVWRHGKKRMRCPKCVDLEREWEWDPVHGCRLSFE